ncbi:MAG: tetratricopeptide repeat protein [Planctomycetota bacterium]
MTLARLSVALLTALAVAGCSGTPDDQPKDTSWSDAEAAYLSGEWSSAIPAYDRFINSHPDDPRIVTAKLRIARAWLAQNRPASALPFIDHAIANAPDRPFKADAHAARGLAQHMLGAPAKAEAEFLEAIRVGEDRVRKDECLYYLGVCKIRAGDWEEGLAYMGSVIKEAPDSPYSVKARSIRSSGVRAFAIQVGAFGEPAGARRRADDLRAKGYDSEIVPEGTLNCVRTGRYATWGEATEAARALETVTGYEAVVVP